MTVHVLHHYFDTPDVEGNEILGVYRDFDDAKEKMTSSVDAVRAEFPNEIWDDDMTWCEEKETHLGFDKPGNGFATIYCWEIVSMEVQ